MRRISIQRQRFRMAWGVGATALAAGVCSMVGSAVTAAPIGLTAATYTQDFNTLITADEAATNRNNRKPSSSDGRSLPPTFQTGLDGWAMSETGTSGNVDGDYAYTDGSSSSSETWATGTIGSTERSLGSTRSGSIRARYGAEFSNAQAGDIVAVNISYTGELWRLGSANEDSLEFEYSTNATGVGDSDGTWIGVSALDYSSTLLLDQNADLFSESTGAKDGNAADYSEAISGSIDFAVPLANGETFWIRWVDINGASSDSILSIDDVNVTGVVPEPGSFALCLTGFATLTLRRRQRD